MKRHPLSLYVTKALKDQLIAASKISGRPLTGEIEARLQRTLDEDHGKSELEVRVDRAMVALREAVLVIVGYHGTDAVDTERRLLFDTTVLEMLKASESGQKEELAPPENRTALPSSPAPIATSPKAKSKPKSLRSA